MGSKEHVCEPHAGWLLNEAPRLRRRGPQVAYHFMFRMLTW
jgi:hypothetical protein